MALRRSTMRKQVIENLSQVAPPGEQFIACIHAETGPSPWLNILFEEIPFAMLVVQILRKYYFLTLTNGHLVVNRAGRLSNRPKEVVVGIPLQQVQMSGIKKGVVWSRLYLQFPGEAKPTRINFHRIWNDDVDRFIAMFPHAVEPGQAPAQPQQAIQQPPQGYAPQPGQYQGQPQYGGQVPQQGQWQAPQQQPQYGGQAPQQQYGGQVPPQGQPPYAPQQGQPPYGAPTPQQGQYPGQAPYQAQAPQQQYPGQQPYQG
ncbi:MAG TPA: hypothetical protein VNW94_00100 [Streptosporangiaceae bacterium]|nr:hypothetical protein [Streptosporangiaceae bacterium]